MASVMKLHPEAWLADSGYNMRPDKITELDPPWQSKNP